jgi:hypothetical protein
MKEYLGNRLFTVDFDFAASRFYPTEHMVGRFLRLQGQLHLLPASFEEQLVKGPPSIFTLEAEKASS